MKISRRWLVQIAYLSLFLILSISLLYWNTRSHIQAQEQKLRHNLMMQASQLIYDEVALYIQDFASLAIGLNQIVGFESSVENKPAIQNLFQQEMTLDHLAYDQIRWLNMQGHEVVRMNAHPEYPQGELVKDKNLQDKSKRYYFMLTARLPAHQLLVSEVDLNIEHGKVEIPYKPVIRISKVIETSSKKKLGVLIVNYRAEKLLKKLASLDALYKNIQLEWLNQGYFWVYHSNPEYQWGDTLQEHHFKRLSLISPQIKAQLPDIQEPRRFLQAPEPIDIWYLSLKMPVQGYQVLAPEWYLLARSLHPLTDQIFQSMKMSLSILLLGYLAFIGLAGYQQIYTRRYKSKKVLPLSKNLPVLNEIFQQASYGVWLEVERATKELTVLGARELVISVNKLANQHPSMEDLVPELTTYLASCLQAELNLAQAQTQYLGIDTHWLLIKTYGDADYVYMFLQEQVQPDENSLPWAQALGLQDDLTKCMNSQALFVQGMRILAEAEHQAGAVYLAHIEIDELNLTMPEEHRRQNIQCFAYHLQQMGQRLPCKYLLVRYQGASFGLLMLANRQTELAAWLEDVRTSWREKAFTYLNAHPIQTTCSLGVAHRYIKHAQIYEISLLLKTAESALAEAKMQGGDAWCIHEVITDPN
ncbi:GGDEF domain-containing protein, diguanylate cyclase (c-di-GMP synthetase) or its enzymatically inactive variants [Allopseudospirillum japonicum]|uniref:GGDEF domain-containing protein, diguanylate cyclase (C-di-GMP synthetase) or its enzymatically inactive variants n=1 Tax=Allopseudospirillum japonicum TaxID=64971 RepID=A0A1H6Q2X7_9GAMM|nr:GGDEF domain-containing protein [Allopseudospirillum japonicum]SEI38199.1 GGDEF domain-containing protein, diguanylate cyclase (c-di-GMP synthetase) or its enzymatically inactive variants [Allopseudospirillum japonicum]